MLYHEIICCRREENPFLRNADLAYDLFLESIISGELKPGDKILQDMYAKKFEMSRTPVRDAMLRLEKQRFIKACGHQGFMVCPIYYSDYSELSKFRSILEEGAAIGAIRSFDDSDLDKMKENVAETERLRQVESDEERRSRLLQLDFDFHRMIIYGSNNRYLITAYEHDISRYFFYQSIVRKSKYNLSYVINTHQQIYQAFLTRNENQVVQLIREHCAFYNKRSIQEIFEKM